MIAYRLVIKMKRNKNKRKKLIIVSYILLAIILFFVVINIIPPNTVMDINPFIAQDGKVMLCAHRGGKISNPENTLKAYKASVFEYDADILETDLWMTKDGYLVLMHDETIDRTSDADEISGIKGNKISDFTLEELRYFNFGYHYSKDGKNYPYQNLVSSNDENRKQIIKDNDLSIVTIEELFDCFYNTHKDLLFIVEIKNNGEKGEIAAQILNDLLSNKYTDYKNRIVIGTFHDEIEMYLRTKHPDLLRGASTQVATNFIITQLLKVNLFDNASFACLQIPTEQLGFNLTWMTYINRAHRRNIAVQYWTINDENEMRMLIEKGCDAIMTDDPELLFKVLNDYNIK